MTHRYKNGFFLSSVSSSAAERHQSEAEGLTAAEAGGLATRLHHSPFHTCHPAGVLHPGGPAGLRRLREPSPRLRPGIRLLHPGGAQLHHRGTSHANHVPLPFLRCCLSFEPGRLSLDNVAGTAAPLQQCIVCQSSRRKQTENNSVLVRLIKSECSHCDKAHYALHVLMLFGSAREGGNTCIQYMF